MKGLGESYEFMEFMESKDPAVDVQLPSFGSTDEQMPRLGLAADLPSPRGNPLEWSHASEHHFRYEIE